MMKNRDRLAFNNNNKNIKSKLNKNLDSKNCYFKLSKILSLESNIDFAFKKIKRIRA